MVRWSARRMNPMSLMSKPGVLKPTFELNRTYLPPILLMPMLPALPVSDRRVTSSDALVRSGRW